jgi:hypothetical protein
MVLAHTVDFRDTAGAPDGTLDWNAWTAVVDAGVALTRGRLSDSTMGFGPIIHERRPTPGVADFWFLDVLTSQRTDIGEAYGEVQAESLISNGANNLEPAYLDLDPAAGVGLLAYQSDLGGTTDIYLYAPMSAVSVQVTWVDGWAGSPAWSR